MSNPTYTVSNGGTINVNVNELFDLSFDFLTNSYDFGYYTLPSPVFPRPIRINFFQLDNNSNSNNYSLAYNTTRISVVSTTITNISYNLPGSYLVNIYQYQGSTPGAIPSYEVCSRVLPELGSFTVNVIGDGPLPCFKENTKILTNNGYIPIENLKKGDLIKTYKHGFLPIVMIGKREINHHACKDRIKNQLYKCSRDPYPEIFEDLVLTGCHSILVDKFASDEERKQTIQVNGDTYVTDKKYRLPSCVDERSSVYEIPGKYTIYHLALENENYIGNYGIYANGLLVESCSIRYLKELSNMELF